MEKSKLKIRRQTIIIIIHENILKILTVCKVVFSDQAHIWSHSSGKRTLIAINLKYRFHPEAVIAKLIY